MGDIIQDSSVSSTESVTGKKQGGQNAEEAQQQHVRCGPCLGPDSTNQL